MKDIEIVLENLNSQGIKLDPAQTLFLKKFINLDASFKAPSFFSKDQSIGNLYLWGPVGRGKTLLLQAISDSYFPDAGRFHFIEFMQLIHSKLSQFSGTRDPLLKVVKTLARDFKLIFIDEFQKSINDWVYFKEKGGPSTDSEHFSAGRVSDNIFQFNSFFHIDEEYDYENTFNPQEFTRSDFQDCENFKSTKEAFLEHFGYIWGSGDE